MREDNFLQELVDIFKPDPHWPSLFHPEAKPMEALQLTTMEKQAIIRDLTLGQSSSSRSTIISKFKKFWRYTATIGIHPLPVQEERLLPYIRWLRDGQEISVLSAPQYLSAVYSVARWFGVTVDKTCPQLITQLMHTWKVAAVDTTARVQAVPFPSKLLFLIKGTFTVSPLRDLDINKLRILVLFWFSFIFFSRADSAFGVYRADVAINQNFITFTEARFKRKRTEQLKTRVRTANCTACPTFLQAFQHYLLLRDSKWHEQMSSSLLLWQLPGEAEPKAGVLRSSLRMATSFWPALVPPQLYSGHSLRRGAASAVLAVGVPLERICWWGGWSFSSASVFEYLDFAVEASVEDNLMFSWMVRPGAGDDITRLRFS